MVTPGSAASLRQGLDRLHGDPGEASAMGKKARQRYESLFTGAIMGKQYAALYRRLLPEQSPQPGPALDGAN